MPYKKRIWIPHYFYHITARGNRKQNIFQDEKDFQIFLDYLEKTYKNFPFELCAYCLMTNHYHLLIRSQSKNIPKIMFSLNKKYADYFNRKYKVTGHLFEKRYHATPVYNLKSLLNVSSYIHLNPLKAQITTNITQYPWSSMIYLTPRKQVIPPYYNPSPILETFNGDIKKKMLNYRNWVDIQAKSSNKSTWSI